jgi:hypothetical protein
MKAYSGHGGITLTSSILGGEWSESCCDCLSLGKNPGIHYIGGWVGHRSDWDMFGNEKTLLKDIKMVKVFRCKPGMALGVSGG